MQPQSTAQRQTREIKARYLTAGMTVIDGTDGPMVVTSVSRPSPDRALVSFEGQPEPTLFGLEVGVTIVDQQDWYFTFGSAQQHDGKYVVIPGSHDEARDEMYRHFGTAWSFQYASPERAGVERFGLVELPRAEWPTPAEAENPDEDDAIAEEIDQAFAEEATEPDLRQRFAAELHRIADDIVRLELPLGHYPSLRFGVVDSRADLDPWTDYLSTTLDAADSTGIPSVATQIKLSGDSYGPELTIGVQSPKEQSEVERLRARVAELEAQHTRGGEPR